MVAKEREAPFLSKTKYLTGLQCPKLLWMHYRAQDQFPPVDPQTQALFDQGHRVTRLFQTLFPGGIEIQGSDDFDRVIGETRSALSLNKSLFEAGFRYKNTYARADVLAPGRDGRWDLYEVKSSTKVEDVHYQDVAFQKYCYEGAGIRIGKTYLVHVNNQYVRNGALDPKALFVREDVTDEVAEWVDRVEPEVDRMMGVLKQAECPEVKIGLQCDEPYECPLKSLCWEFLPKESVFVLNRIRRKEAFRLIEEGILDVRHVAEGYPLTESQRIQRECHVGNRVHVDPSAIRSFLDQLRFPVHFLDFETVGSALPFYDSSRPYQQVPFQFSLHILPGWDRAASHYAFLADGVEDPRPELLSRLKSLLGKAGTVLSYNMSFELGRLKESVEAHPEYEKWLREIEERFLDLIVPFRQFDYYDPKQLGRTSIKNVFPALTGGTYEGLGIADGSIAGLEYARVTFFGGASPEERDRVRKDLETYCALDTQAMIDILKVLRHRTLEGSDG